MRLAGGGNDAAARIACARFFAENVAVQARGLERTVTESADSVNTADAALATSGCSSVDGPLPFAAPSAYGSHDDDAPHHPPGLPRPSDAARPSGAARPVARRRARLADDRFSPLVRMEAPAATDEILSLCHPLDYIEAIREATPKEGIVHLDADTSMSPGTFEASIRAPAAPCTRSTR